MTPTEAVLALLASGLTESAIAASVGSTQPTINRIRRGAMVPNYPLGKSLVDLAERLPAQPQADEAA